MSGSGPARAPGRGPGAARRTRRRAEAFVAAVDRGRYRTWLGDREVTAMKARELGRGGIVVGDMVSLAGDVSGQPGTLARVVRVRAADARRCAGRPTTPTRSSGSSSPTPTSW